MITNFNKPSRKDDIKLITWIVVIFLFIVWLCTPPGNKFLQMCLWGNHVQYFFANISNPGQTNEYIFHRNNAIYLAKLYKDKTHAIQEMDKAIETLPAYISEKELNTLYSERAKIKVIAGDYNGALNDYIHSGDIKFQDYLTVAMLFKEKQNYKQAISFCNAILSADNTAYAGFACLADLYSSLEKYGTAVRIWDLAIDRKKNNPRAYMDRAKLKKLMGDEDGYKADYAKAKEYLPTLSEDDSIIYDALHPKKLTLQIRPLK